MTTAAERFRLAASSSSSAFRHGIKVTIRMMDTDGEEVALAWFHEHEALPAHIEARCPMAVIASVPDLDGARS